MMETASIKMEAINVTVKLVSLEKIAVSILTIAKNLHVKMDSVLMVLQATIAAVIPGLLELSGSF